MSKDRFVAFFDAIMISVMAAMVFLIVWRNVTERKNKKQVTE